MENYNLDLIVEKIVNQVDYIEAKVQSEYSQYQNVKTDIDDFVKKHGCEL